MTFRPMPVLTVLSVISLAILIWLGNWQYGRYTAKMAQAEPSAPIAAPEAVTAIIELENDGKAQQLYGTMDGEPVWRRYVPARLEDNGELVLVLWDATGGPQPVALNVSEAQLPYARIANILTRDTDRGTFAAKDDPDNNIWHSMDTRQMAKQLGYGAKQLRVVETVEVTVRNSENLSQARRTQNPYAYQEVLDPLPPERHFGYALTWWGMAIGLLGVYLALHHSQGRLRFRS